MENPDITPMDIGIDNGMWSKIRGGIMSPEFTGNKELLKKITAQGILEGRMHPFPDDANKVFVDIDVKLIRCAVGPRPVEGVVSDGPDAPDAKYARVIGFMPPRRAKGDPKFIVVGLEAALEPFGKSAEGSNRPIPLGPNSLDSSQL